MRVSRSTVGCFLVVLSLLPAARFTARAEDKKKSEQESTNPAYTKTLSAAMAEYELGNWTEARALFEQAHELNPNARTLRAIGLCAFEEKSYVAAIANLSAALEDTRRPLTPEQRTHAADLLERSHGFIAQYTVQVSPANAIMRVDLRAPVVLNGKLLLDPGTHQLSFSAPGYQPAERTLLARPREGGVLKVELASAVAVASAAPLGAQTGASKPQTDERAGGLSARQKAGIGVAAFGLASLGVGIAYGVIAKNKHDDSGCTNVCDSEHTQKLNDQARTAGNVATVGYALGAAALGSGAFMIFWPQRADKSVAWGITPNGARGGSAFVHGRF
jgi:Tetratricopeptide repeat